MLTALLEVILPVLLVAAVGALLARTFRLDQDTLGKVSLHGLTPALAFNAVLTTQVSAGDGLRLALGYGLVTVLGALLAALASPRTDPATRRAVIACVIIGNNANFGLPVALLALGQAGLEQAVLLFVCSLLVMFTAGPALLGARTGITGGIVTVVRLPVTWALAAALLLRAAGMSLPVGVTRGIDLLADAAIPLILLMLGVQLVQSERIHLDRPVVTAVILRVFAGPLLALAVGHLIGMRGLSLQSLVLAWAMPTAVNTFMLAREYGSAPDMTASAVALSTLIGIGTLAYVISALPTFA